MDSNIAPASADIDLDLTERVNEAIHGLDVLRGTRAHVFVSVTNAHVTIAGVVQSPMAAAEVERAVAEVPGIARVTSRLTDDATLCNQVAEALATDPLTAAIPPGYEVVSNFGHMWIVGHFTPEQSQAVTAVCRGVPNLITVTIKAI